MSERWLPVVGWEGHYEVSDMGRVRSVERVVYMGRGHNRRAKSVMLRQHAPNYYMTLHLSRDGKPKLFYTHQLVAAAFIGERNGLDVLHTNGDYHDNRASNLRYGTKSANTYDSIRHGTHFNASKTHCKHGHEFSPENTRHRPGRGGRVCRTCVRITTSRRYGKSKSKTKETAA